MGGRGRPGPGRCPAPSHAFSDDSSNHATCWPRWCPYDPGCNWAAGCGLCNGRPVFGCNGGCSSGVADAAPPYCAGRCTGRHHASAHAPAGQLPKHPGQRDKSMVRAPTGEVPPQTNIKEATKVKVVPATGRVTLLQEKRETMKSALRCRSSPQRGPSEAPSGSRGYAWVARACVHDSGRRRSGSRRYKPGPTDSLLTDRSRTSPRPAGSCRLEGQVPQCSFWNTGGQVSFGQGCACGASDCCLRRGCDFEPDRTRCLYS